MTPPLINAKMADAVLERIHADPKSHIQTYWFTRTECGTAGCFAGNAVLIAGGTPLWGDGMDGDLALLCWLDGEAQAVPDVARKLLQLPEDCRDYLGPLGGVCAQMLFNGENSLQELEQYVQQLKDGIHICGKV